MLRIGGPVRLAAILQASAREVRATAADADARLSRRASGTAVGADRMILRTTSIGVLFLAQVLLACGDGDDGDDTGDEGGATIDRDLVTADVAELLCEASSSCECTTRPAEVSDCVDAVAPAIAGGVSQGETLGLRYHEDCLALATAYSDALSCGNTGETEGDDAVSQVRWEALGCKLLTGDGTLGDPCLSMGSVGFIRLGDTCAQGLHCADPFCVELLEPGDLCAVGFCPPGTTCSDPDADGVTTCEPPSAAGERCNPHASTCPSELQCDPMELVCAEPPGAGQPCPQGRCTSGSLCVNEMCEELPGDGDPCGSFGCATGLRCDFNTNTCVPPLGAGETCSFPEDCAEGLTCDQFVAMCVALPEEGEACISGLCADDLLCDFDSTCVRPPPVTCQLPFCIYRFDGLCDEPEGTGLCEEGTDPEDCEMDS
jgi:hypothetical protein